jgi:regulator of protease activity HflC (stomatin/prohibitin superfamily)
LYERYGVLSADNDIEQTRLSRIEPDPEKRTVFSEVMRAIAKRQSKGMTKEARAERAKKGAQARWGPKDEEKTED